MTRKGSSLFVLALLLTLVDVQAAWAGCFGEFRNCVQAAFAEEKWYDRAIMMADCELDLWACVRGKLIG